MIGYNLSCNVLAIDIILPRTGQVNKLVKMKMAGIIVLVLNTI